MDFFDSLSISASGLTAQQLRMNVISSNLANINTTRTPEGGPYQRKEILFASEPIRPAFQDILHSQMSNKLSGVRVVGIADDPRPALMKYEPTNPEANAQGYVAAPNINLIEEMVNMISATRSYEAGITAINSTKNMALKALEIGR